MHSLKQKVLLRRTTYALILCAGLCAVIASTLHVISVSRDAVVVAKLPGSAFPVDGLSPRSASLLHTNPGQAVVLVVHRGCAHCAAMLGNLQHSTNIATAKNLLIVANGAINGLSIPPGAHLEENSRIPTLLHIHRTPTALLLGADLQVQRVLMGDDESVRRAVLAHLAGDSSKPSAPTVQPGVKECAACRVD